MSSAASGSGRNTGQYHPPNGAPTTHVDSRPFTFYPFANATPVTHITRHLSSLSVTQNMPSYMAPDYFNPTTHASGQTMSGEHAEAMAILSSPEIPKDPRYRVYWEASRDEAVQLLNEASGSNICAQPTTYKPEWSDPPLPSAFTTSPFALAIMQQTVPHMLPAPPPPGIRSSSSSLANALGPLKVEESKGYSQETKDFLHSLIQETIKEVPPRPYDVHPTPVHHDSVRPRTPPSSATAAMSSPDPLALRASTPLTPLTPSTTTTTPKKRKMLEVVIETPSKKLHLNTDNIKPRSLPSPFKLQPYVQITTPFKYSSTPTSTLRNQASSPGDLGGYGPADGMTRTTGKRTGDRDGRAPLEKFTSLLSEIFEAEDNIPSDATADDLHNDFFSHLTIDPVRPMLHSNMMRKITKSVGKVAHPTKRMRLTSWDSGGPTPHRAGVMAEVDTNTLSRLLKSLERSVKAGEDLDPFLTANVHTRKVSAQSRPPTASPEKKKKAKKSTAADNKQAESSPPPTTGDGQGEGTMDTTAGAEDFEVNEQNLDKLERSLEIARDSILAADCCVALLASDRLNKQLYSEELITSCLTVVKNSLTKIIYPFIESSPNNQSNSSPLLQHIIKHSSTSQSSPLNTLSHRRYIGEIFQAVAAVIPRLSNLLGAEIVSMSDSIIIQAVYIATGPFFVVENGAESEGKGKKDSVNGVISSTIGSSALRGLRLDALSLIRTIFANHEDQRSWIIEEILTSLIKLSDSNQKAGYFRLRDGRSIRTVSALLLQLVQTSVHDTRIEASRIEKTRQQQHALRRQDSINNEDQESLLDEKDMEEIRLYQTALDAPTKAAKTIVLFLSQRSGKSKTSKNTNEAEYRAIFDNLISDLLVVLFWPEWPAAGLVLNIVCKFMITSLDDVKSAAQNDNNASKAIALDHLGVIAGKLRTNSNKRSTGTCNDSTHNSPLLNLEEIMSNAQNKQLGRLITAHQDLATNLSKRSTEDSSCESAREMSAVMWGQELALTLTKCNAAINDGNGGSDKKAGSTFACGKKLKAALRDLWKEAPTDVFENTDQEEIVRIDRIAEKLGSIHHLRNAFDPILNVILNALDAPPVFMRTKALRALSQILTVDSSVLSNPSVRRVIESHLLDSSSAVRDAAVELIGKYMLDSPEVASQYYQKIADRIADTGLGVRKRVIKLMKVYYGVTDDMDRRIDICTRLVLRVLDEDETVKDLAIKTIEELWFTSVSSINASQPARASSPKVALASQNKAHCLTTVAVIMGVSNNFKQNQAPLEDTLHKIVTSAETANEKHLPAIYGDLCDTLIEGLVDASDFPGFTVLNCVRTIHLFTSAYPSTISGTKASTLLPYLGNPTTSEDQLIADYIMKIFIVSIPTMPKTAAKFGADLQRILQPMVVKPSAAAGISALQETVACFCAVVNHLTHDFVRLVALLKSCNARLMQFINRRQGQALNPQDLRALTMVVYIVSLLGEHFDFDHVRLEVEGIATELDTISKGPIIRHIYDNLLRLYDMYGDSGLRGRLLQCLGFLFRAQPTLMTLESSATMMDAIFSSDEWENRGRLLKLLQEFLVSEAAKNAVLEKETLKNKTSGTKVNMDELVGNTHGFAESGVSSTIVQRYLVQIQEAALSPQAHLHTTAIDILSFTIKQGLAHPLQSFPVIIALETSANTVLSNRASALHAILQSKHASLLNAGYVKAARTSYEYQQRVTNGPVNGYRLQPTPTALLHKWYGLVREKRPTRQDFLKAIMKIFDVHHGSELSYMDIEFTRYMIENVASFDYKTQEEVFLVIKHLTAILSTSGTQLVEILSPSHLLATFRGAQTTSQESNVDTSKLFDADPSTTLVSQGNADALSKSSSDPRSPASGEERLAMIRSCVLIGMAMLLKAHLKTLYGLTEEKCTKWVPGKKSTIGDKPAVKRNENPISWERMPFATKPVETSEDMDEQQNAFLTIWSEDGTTVEADPDLLE